MSTAAPFVFIDPHERTIRLKLPENGRVRLEVVDGIITHYHADVYNPLDDLIAKANEVEPSVDVSKLLADETQRTRDAQKGRDR